MKAVNIERDEKAVEAAKYISQYCADHSKCIQCIFSFSQVCLLKLKKPDGWTASIEKVMDRRKNK